MSLERYIFCNDNIMSSSHQFAIMSLQGLEENAHEVCDNYLSICNIGNCLWNGLLVSVNDVHMFYLLPELCNLINKVE